MGVLSSQVGRRDVARYFAASALLATACERAPHRKIVAYGKQPTATPGVPRTYATTMTLGGYGTGLLCESHDGRPTKIEGNPDHPASLGGTSALAQAQTLALYDPDRLTSGRHDGTPVSFEAIVRKLGKGGSAALERVAILAEPTSSPVLVGLLDDAERRGARVFFHDPLPRTSVWGGAELAFGQRLEPIYDLSRADVVVALDADVLADGPFHLRYARQHADRRRRGGADRGRMYVAEPSWTPTGTVADHRLPVRRCDIPSIANALFRAVVVGHDAPPSWALALRNQGPQSELATEGVRQWVHGVARDLLAHRDHAVVIAGTAQPPVVHALANLLSSLLTGSSVRYVQPVVAGTPSLSMEPLLAAIDAHAFDLLVILGGNPAYTAPPEEQFSRRVMAVRDRVYLAPYENETASTSNWLIGAAHFLESWGDARALDGTLSYTQPLILPLHGGKTAAEVTAGLFGAGPSDGRALLIADGRAKHPEFEATLGRALAAGVEQDSAATPVSPEPRVQATSVFSPTTRETTLEVVFDPDPRVRDGAFTNNAWLLELPHSITQQTWGNAVTLSVSTARTHAITAGAMIELRVAGRTVTGPAIVVPGQADGTLAVPLGYGRAGAESLAHGLGFDAGRIRTADATWHALDVEIKVTGARVVLALGQVHPSMEGRDLAAEIEADDLDAGEERLAGRRATPPTLYDLRPKGGRQWGMTIDLDTCTQRTSHALATGRPLFRAGGRPSRGPSPAARVRALREGALRVRVPRRCHRPQRRWAQRDGLQPLRGNPILFQQLSLQGPALQLVRLQPGQAGDATNDDEPRRHRARPGSHGEVHVLRAAHTGGRNPRARRRSANRGRRGTNGLRAGMPVEGDRVR